MPKHNPDLVTNLSFSVFTRYQSVADHVNALRITSDEVFNILEVGGRGNFLKRFLPKDKITILDLDDSDEPNYVKGDGRKLPFKKHSFDIVVSTDVLEHIPPKDREQYLKEQIRVAKQAIILSGPLYTPEIAQIEKQSNDYYQQLTGEEHPWLKEHVGYGLPEAANVEKIFKQGGLRFVKSWNQRVELWSQMVLIDLLVATAYTPEVEQAFLELSRSYNTEIFPYDCDDNGYRTIYTAFVDGDRKPKPLKRSHFSSIPPTVIEKFQQRVFELLIAVQRHHLSIISDKDRHIGILTQNLTALQPDSDLISVRKEKESYKQRLTELERLYAELNHQLNNIYSSRKWRAGLLISSAYRLLKSPVRLIRRTLGILRREGPLGLHKRILRRWSPTTHYPISLPDINKQYQIWLRQHPLTEERLNGFKKEQRLFKLQPQISVVIPTYKPPLDIIKQTVDSVQQQIYQNWELIIVDDGSNTPGLTDYFNSLSDQPRIKVKLNKGNKGIVGSTNEALKLASGEFVAFLDHDDLLTPDALFQVVKHINLQPKVNWLYSDEDKIDSQGRRTDPYFKSSFAPYFLMSQMYTCHLSVYRKKFGDSLGWLRQGLDGSQDYDLALRAAENTMPVHIPEILYHWRIMDGSTAQSQSEKPYANRASVLALEDALKRRKLGGTVEAGLQEGTFRVRPSFDQKATVSIIIPTRNQTDLLRSCLNSILSKTKYKNYEIIVLDNQSDEKGALRYFETLKHHPKITVERYDLPFNFSAINNYGAKIAKGDFLLFLNNDTEVINGEWLESMLELAAQKDVGAVGAKLLYPNHTIQHAGVVLGIGGIAGHSHKYVPDNFPGYFSQKDLIREYSAITGGCLLIGRSKFEVIGGFDEDFVIAYNDVDLCLRLREKGYLNLYTPYARLFHHESVSVGQPDSAARDRERLSHEIKLINNRWGNVLGHDPYYSQHLSLEREDSSLRLESTDGQA